MKKGIMKDGDVMLPSWELTLKHFLSKCEQNLQRLQRDSTTRRRSKQKKSRTGLQVAPS
jgi:hypothetical protein